MTSEDRQIHLGSRVSCPASRWSVLFEKAHIKEELRILPESKAMSESLLNNDHFMGLGGVVVVGVYLTFKDGGKKSSENGRREDQAPLAGGEAGGCLEEEGAHACCSCCCCGVTRSSCCSTFSSPICCLKFPSRSVCDLRPFILPVLLRRSAQGTLVPPRLGLLTSQPSSTVPGRW